MLSHQCSNALNQKLINIKVHFWESLSRLATSGYVLRHWVVALRLGKQLDKQTSTAIVDSLRPIGRLWREETVFTRLHTWPMHTYCVATHLLLTNSVDDHSQFVTFLLHVHVMHLFTHIITVLLIKPIS